MDIFFHITDVCWISLLITYWFWNFNISHHNLQVRWHIFNLPPEHRPSLSESRDRFFRAPFASVSAQPVRSFRPYQERQVLQKYICFDSIWTNSQKVKPESCFQITEILPNLTLLRRWNSGNELDDAKLISLT